MILIGVRRFLRTASAEEGTAIAGSAARPAARDRFLNWGLRCLLTPLMLD